jgi:potassium efflux system protein
MLYAMLNSAVERIAQQRHRQLSSAPPGEEEQLPQGAVTERIQRFIRVAFILIGAVLLAQFWGIDEQALTMLDETKVYPPGPVTDEASVVSAYDALAAVPYITITIWLVRNLSNIFELLVFPRFRLDSGARYAVLTITRYTIFTIGVLLAFAAIQLDLSQLGWLIAALGVGLGFGLQEIVSNFVSGIILLVERPIQVDDVVTVGSTSGTVTKINIRATTLVNFDKQEVVLPNHNLITSEVTNWTRGTRSTGWCSTSAWPTAAMWTRSADFSKKSPRSSPRS